jgi:hypothetical protein
MQLNYKLLIAISFLALLLSCRRQAGEAVSPEKPALADSSAGIVVADTIIYQVLITNYHGDAWTQKCLGGLHKKALVDSIFGMVYAEKAIAFNHETNEQLTLHQVKDIEKADGFSRDHIGMIQFTEIWYLNTRSNSMTKKVLSMVLGYDVYSSDGELFGHKPLFRIQMRDQKK